jgi:hypothetical protein
MFKLLNAFIGILFVFPMFLYGQITIDNTDMPAPGDTIRLSSTLDLLGINFSATGQNYTWDFSMLEALSQTVDTFVTIQETPWVYQLVFFTSSNQAKKLTEFDQFPGFEVSETYEYFNNSSNDYRSVGVGVTMNGLPLPNKYESPDIIYKFPVQYGSQDSSVSSYEFDIPGIGYAGGWKKRVNHVDGWGTLITPYGEFETIRMKTNIQQYDSLYIDSLGFGFPVFRNYDEYKWLGKDFGAPLCRVEDGLIPTFTYIDSVRNSFTSQEDILEEKFDVRISPNPFYDNLIVELEVDEPEEASIYLMDITGRILMEKPVFLTPVHTNRITMEVKNTGLLKGLYLIRIDFKHSGGCIRKIVKL